MDSKSYLALNAWLQKSDRNYIEGRFLWLNLGIDGACNLLWLALEQLIKIILLQINIDTFSKKALNLEELHIILTIEGKKLGHDASILIKNINSKYSKLNITKFEQVLLKLQEYFYKRYVDNQNSSISFLMLEEIDELYFLLRNEVSPDVGVGTIDEIFIQKKHNWDHPLPIFSYAYQENKYFKTRKHTKIVYSFFDGSRTTYSEDGTDP